MKKKANKFNKKNKNRQFKPEKALPETEKNTVRKESCGDAGVNALSAANAGQKPNSGNNETQNGTSLGRADIAKNFFSWAGANFFTKVLGYLRDAAVVAAFGGGAMTDAYYAAFRLTNLFRRTLGEGGLNAVFIPGYAVERNKGGSNAEEFAARFWTATLCGSMLAAAAGIVFCRPLTMLTAAGFKASPDYFAFTALLTAVFAPHFLFVNVSAYFTALLNSKGKFFRAAIAPGIFSIAVLAVLALYAAGAFDGLPPQRIILIMAAAASLSGILQAALLYPQLKKEGFSLRLSRLRDSAKVFPLVIAAVPATAVLAQDQIALVLDTAFASFLSEGSITAIYNAARLTQFPVSMFAAAAAVTALPYLSRFAAEKNNIAFNAHLYRAVFTSQIMLIPAAAGLAAIALPLCALLFEHGNFTPEQTEITAKVLIYSCLGLPFFGLNKVLASALYAAADKKMPAAVIGTQLLFNAILCFAFMDKMGAAGLLLATAISSAAASALFLAIMRRRTGFNIINPALAKILFAAGCSGGFAWLISAWLESPLAITIIAVPSAAAVFFAALIMLKVSELKLLTGTIVRRR